MSMSQALDGAGVFSSIASELNVSPDVVRTGANALLPAIVAGLGRSAVSGMPAGASGAMGGGLGGLGGLAGAILGGGGGGLLDSVLGNGATPVDKGNDVLGQIFGQKDVSRSVATEAADSTGLDQTFLKKLLPILAMAVAGYLAKQAMQGQGANAGASPAGSGSGGLGGGALGGLVGALVKGLAPR